MSLESLLRQLSNALRGAGIPFMITGSIAAGFRGASRATMDVDAVIDPTRAQLEDFVRRAEEMGFYVSPEAAHEAFADRGMFNIVDPDSGWKADLILRKQRAFSDAEFARREATEIFGIPLAIASLEDLVLSKLEWAALGASTRQLDDVRALLRVNGDTLDHEYLERWIDSLGVRIEWDSVRADL